MIRTLDPFSSSSAVGMELARSPTQCRGTAAHGFLQHWIRPQFAVTSTVEMDWVLVKLRLAVDCRAATSDPRNIDEGHVLSDCCSAHDLIQGMERLWRIASSGPIQRAAGCGIAGDDDV